MAVGLEVTQDILWDYALDIAAGERLGFTAEQDQLFSPYRVFLRLNLVTGVMRPKEEHVDIPVAVPAAGQNGQIKFDVEWVADKNCTVGRKWQLIDREGTELMYGDFTNDLTVSNSSHVTFQMALDLDGVNPDLVFKQGGPV